MNRLLFTFVCLLTAGLCGYAQQYTGMSGLIHVPSAEMDNAGDARIGAHFLNGHFTPDQPYWYFEGKKYHTADFYVSLTPFKWVELGYTITLFRGIDQRPGENSGYNKKDRYMSIKFRPLEEGKYWPAVALGSNDFLSSAPLRNNNKSDDSNGFWRNYYIALTKSFDIKGHILAPTLTYRYFTNHFNHRWNGLVGGVVYKPSFARNLRLTVEWTGCDVNVGVDCLLWRHLLVQGSLQDGRWPSAGLCYKVNLF